MLSRLASSRTSCTFTQSVGRNFIKQHPIIRTATWTTPSSLISSLSITQLRTSERLNSHAHRQFHTSQQQQQQQQQQQSSNSHSDSNSDSNSNSSSSSSSSQKQSRWQRFIDDMRRFGAWYGRVLEEHPYKTQMATSGFLGGIADVTTQYLEQGWAIEDGEEPHPWDFRRLAAVTAFGIFLMGPVGHIWYQQLERFTHAFCKSKGSMIFTKVCGDTFLFGPVALASFFAVVSWLEGVSGKDIYAKLRRDFVPTYIVDYSMWPIVQGLNFYFVPVRHQLLCVNTVCYFDDVFLSYVQHNGIPKIFEIIEDAWADYLDDPDETEHGTKAKARKAAAALALERAAALPLPTTTTPLPTSTSIPSPSTLATAKS